ncbi:hypothetical protein DYH09_27055 [bacterium CPR1]|nr:hypothetical protein [bacterium CPR1]
MVISRHPSLVATTRWARPRAAGPPERQADSIDVGAATRILTQGEEIPSQVKLWEVDLGERVTQLGVARDGSILANVPNGYIRLAAANGASSPRVEHELLQSTPMPSADGATYLVGSWGVARIEADGTQSWQKYLGSSVFNQPLAAPDGGVVATPCSQGEVHRLDSKGELKWVCELEPKPCYGAEVKGPMAQDGLGRLLMNSEGRLYAVDFESGEKLWSKKLDAESVWFCNGPVVTRQSHPRQWRLHFAASRPAGEHPVDLVGPQRSPHRPVTP